jgi:hypothetical protein
MVRICVYKLQYVAVLGIDSEGHLDHKQGYEGGHSAKKNRAISKKCRYVLSLIGIQIQIMNHDD